MSIHDAMTDACRAVGIVPPSRVHPGRWVKTPVDGKGRANGSGRVMLNSDGETGVAYNWITGEARRFSEGGIGAGKAAAPYRPDPEEQRRERERQAAVADACARIVAACETVEHPYLARKGFAQERGLVIEDPRPHLPGGELGEAMARALPENDGPLLVIPGRIDRRVTTVQFVTADGVKKNILGGVMRGAAHRIATGRETWVCEGIATAMTVRAALRLLGRSATVWCAFSASNVATVAKGLRGSIIAADHDRPLDQLGGLGTGEFYATNSGHAWTMPLAMGDFNDWHERDGLRAVALHLREVSGR